MPSRVTDEEKALRAADKAYKKRVRTAEDALKTADEGQPLEKLGDVTLYADRATHKGTTLDLLTKTTTTVNARGSVTTGKDGKKLDSRELYLVVENTDGGFTAKLQPDKGEAVERLAQRIRLASGPAAVTARADRDAARADAQRVLDATRADRSEVLAAELALSPEQVSRTRRRERWSWLKWAGAGVAALLVIAAIAGGSGQEDKGKDAPTVAATSTPTTTAAVAPVAPDTGRMSTSEFQDMQRVTFAFDEEAQTFLEGIAGKCNVLMQAGDLAAGSECIQDAYSGVDEKANFATFTYKELRGATAEACKAALSKLRAGVERYAGSMDQLAELGANLTQDAGLVTGAVQLVKSRQTSFNTRHGNAAVRCRPA